MFEDDAKEKICEIADDFGSIFMCQVLVEWLIDRRNEDGARPTMPVEQASNLLNDRLWELVYRGLGESKETLPREVGGE